jgi:hypothetical protein
LGLLVTLMATTMVAKESLSSGQGEVGGNPRHLCSCDKVAGN